MKITDEMVERACEAYGEIRVVEDIASPTAMRAMRAALEAALEASGPETDPNEESPDAF